MSSKQISLRRLGRAQGSKETSSKQLYFCVLLQLILAAFPFWPCEGSDRFFFCWLVFVFVFVLSLFSDMTTSGSDLTTPLYHLISPKTWKHIFLKEGVTSLHSRSPFISVTIVASFPSMSELSLTGLLCVWKICWAWQILTLGISFWKDAVVAPILKIEQKGTVCVPKTLKRVCMKLDIYSLIQDIHCQETVTWVFLSVLETHYWTTSMQLLSSWNIYSIYLHIRPYHL